MQANQEAQLKRYRERYENIFKKVVIVFLTKDGREA